MLPQAAVDELKEIWERHSGEVISKEEAWAMANRIIALHEIVAELGSTVSENQVPTEDSGRRDESVIEVLGPRLARVQVSRERIQSRR